MRPDVPHRDGIALPVESDMRFSGQAGGRDRDGSPPETARRHKRGLQNPFVDVAALVTPPQRQRVSLPVKGDLRIVAYFSDGDIDWSPPAPPAGMNASCTAPPHEPPRFQIAIASPCSSNAICGCAVPGISSGER